MNVTLLFPDYHTAVAAAKALGFWDDDSDTLRTSGQTIPEDEGVELTPPTRLSGYAVNATGELPPAALAYAIPYGSAARLFGGSGAEPYTYEPIVGQPGHVTAVAVELPPEPDPQ
jgi:hypothetical protein